MSPAEPTIGQLQQLIAQISRVHPHLTTRLEKAAFLLLLRPIHQVGGQYRIGSEDGLKSYEIINGHCSCHDYVRHGPGHPCKHRLALDLHRQLRGEPGELRKSENDSQQMENGLSNSLLHAEEAKQTEAS